MLQTLFSTRPRSRGFCFAYSTSVLLLVILTGCGLWSRFVGGPRSGRSILGWGFCRGSPFVKAEWRRPNRFWGPLEGPGTRSGSGFRPAAGWAAGRPGPTGPRGSRPARGLGCGPLRCRRRRLPAGPGPGRGLRSGPTAPAAGRVGPGRVEAAGCRLVDIGDQWTGPLPARPPPLGACWNTRTREAAGALALSRGPACWPRAGRPGPERRRGQAPGGSRPGRRLRA